MTRDAETVTFHFDLSHLTHLGTHQDFTLRTPGARTTLTRHTAQTRNHHAQSNSALAQLDDDRRNRFTHYAETVSLPTGAISFCWVGYPSRHPGPVADECAALFHHVPRSAVRRALRRLRRNGDGAPPSRLRAFGATMADVQVDSESLHLDASELITPAEWAVALVMQHPDFGTQVPEDYWLIAETLIPEQPSFDQVWAYLAENPPESTRHPWYVSGYATDDAGHPVQPVAGLTDQDGEVVEWPTALVDGRIVPVIPQRTLSAALDEVLRPVILELGRAVMKRPDLKGKQWSTQHGVTGLVRTNAIAPQGQPTPAKTHWTLVGKTSMYGLDLYQNTIEFNEDTQTLTFNVKNWPNRGLGVYVQFLDIDDKPINNPEGWKNRPLDWPAALRLEIQPNPSKKFLRHLGPGNAVFGVPVWAPEEEISFPVPAGAVGANILFGGLGAGEWDMDVDMFGIIHTCVFCYGIPALLAALSVGAKSTAWYRAVIEDNYILQALIAHGAILVRSQITSQTETLYWAAGKAAGIIFSKGLEKLAQTITGYATAAEIIENVPFVGWALRVASLGGAIANMAATTAAVGLSPATYQLQAKRSMTLRISVTPDPRHLVWPEQADHFVIDVRYRGGTTLTKTGRMPARADAPIIVTYSLDTGDAVPTARGQEFQIVAGVYSVTDELWGKWVGAWTAAVPNDGDGRTETGAITERLAPLTAETQYVHTKKLAYDASAKTYRWDATAPAPQQTTTSLGQPGQDMVALVGITMNDPAHRLGYCYQVKNQNLPMDYDSAARANPMFVLRGVSTLADPADGMLSPTRGFSMQPQIAYDHFGSEDADGALVVGAQNFYLDTRTYGSSGLCHLRQVDLPDKGDSTFRYDSTLSWGAFGFVHLDAMVVHPNGYVAAVSYHDNKLAILKLPPTGVPDKSAPQALPFSGQGSREGLLDGPVGLTVTLDGRILVLERSSARIQAFDTNANPVPCFAGTMDFVLGGSGFAAQLDSGAVEPSLLQALQGNVPVFDTAAIESGTRYLCCPVVTLPKSFASVLDAGHVTPELVDKFADRGLTLGDDAAILRTAPGLWLLLDSATRNTYDVRLDGERVNEVDVYRCFAPTAIVKSPGSEWLVLDKTHTLSFAVTAQRDGRLRFRGLTSIMPLKKDRTAKLTYLDIGVEAKGFIYVLSYANDGVRPADYRIDIYGPDGTALNANAHHGAVNADRLTVDRWRTLFTLNYEQLQGRDGRPEPTVSQWNPKTPPPRQERNA